MARRGGADFGPPARGEEENKLTRCSHPSPQKAIDVPTETVVLVAVSDASASDLARQLSPDEPRYAFYRHSLSSAADLAESAAAAAAAPVLFVYTCPTASKIKERMLYASMRGYVAGPLAEQAGLSVAKKVSREPCTLCSRDAYEDTWRGWNGEAPCPARTCGRPVPRIVLRTG